ncbi:substrate-binding domain-containing protein [Paenibacillus abyssi]|uniref:Sugar ABC transporter substrate-binding protein n=1 Tax=Paenibacillus abyssi TaxID=1340531 RepID=A0A917CPU3_9BACL|nr:substrate-binding domain-containing protein [Paenibacillus abyssi]GGF93159.1 sugar ABC transporter substrate-binding protein [Paenibacillus abyssi]
MSMKRSIQRFTGIAILTLLLVVLAACGNSNEPSGEGAANAEAGQNTVTTQAGQDDSFSHPMWYKAPTEQELEMAKADNISDVLLSTGPNGEPAFPASDIVITDEQKEQIKAGGFRAAIAMSAMNNDWATQQVAGMQDTFKELGIEVISVTDANFKDAEQIAQIESISAQKPDVLVAAAVNTQTTTQVFKKVADAGIKIVFVDQPVTGLVPGEDYVSVVSADNFGNGMVAADELAKALDGKGTVGAIYFAPDFFVTNQRYQGFVTRLQAKYPDIELITTQGFNDQNQTESIAGALLTKYKDIDSMWVAWSDPPAMGVVSAARTAGRTPADFKIVTEDLNTGPALDIAQNSYIKGLGAQRPYDQGVAEAQMAALSLIGASTETYVAVPALAVNRDNLAEAYETIFHKPVPDNILEALGE